MNNLLNLSNLDPNYTSNPAYNLDLPPYHPDDFFTPVFDTHEVSSFLNKTLDDEEEEEDDDGGFDDGISSVSCQLENHSSLENFVFESESGSPIVTRKHALLANAKDGRLMSQRGREESCEMMGEDRRLIGTPETGCL